ncbi:TetR/AcrR family transcriptional regulator [Mycobacterium sp. Marseille-P9652]|uniref:TetR/AcrR family transcriptional regulator n=1 Tax=Mycobacterium sp. Marseille-P9652 TaxID=2654950 RepID=UPI0012E75FFD|nr:TetR/AcrR family transcriptional regulator [Mycobacterium sp. Marseille-P9652]
MPRNRRPQAPEEKRGEILAVAERLFTEVGYDKTSMVQLAAAAGVTPTTIYWYFEDKDALLVGVLEQIVGKAVAELATLAEMALSERVLWVVRRLERYHNLVTVVHSRTAVSSRIDQWHSGFHLLVEAMLAHGLREAGFAEAEIAARTALGVFAVEGLLTHQLDKMSRRALIELVTENHARPRFSS